MHKPLLSLLLTAAVAMPLGMAQDAPAPSAGGEPKTIKPVPAAPAPPQKVEKPAPPAKPKVQKYVIQSGDNPWLIAKNHGVSLEELLAVNEIKDPKNLKIGDVLILPEGTDSKNKPTAKPKESAKPKNTVQTAPAEAEWEYYTIQSGDNPWTIAKKLKRDHQQIMKLNEGMNFRDLKIGQQIKVPKG